MLGTFVRERNFFRGVLFCSSKKGRGGKSENVYTSVDFTRAEIKADWDQRFLRLRTVFVGDAA